MASLKVLHEVSGCICEQSDEKPVMKWSFLRQIWKIEVEDLHVVSFLRNLKSSGIDQRPKEIGICGLLTKREILAKLFFACLWTEMELRSINSQKKRMRPISSHLDRTSLVKKGYIIWHSGKFFLRDTACSPERTRQLHLARSGSFTPDPEFLHERIFLIDTDEQFQIAMPLLQEKHELHVIGKFWHKFCFV